MIDSGFYNMDCMDAMKQFPDKFFDLAIVDPPYGGVTKGGYMFEASRAKRKAPTNTYHDALWEQDKPNKDYFKELFRVSKNQIVWGGELFCV